MVVPQLPRTTPEEQNVRSEGIVRFLDEIHRQNLELHSFMFVRHGHVIAEGWWEPYRRSYPHMLFSLSKSFTSTAIGFAEAEGLLTLDDPVIGYFSEDLPEEISPNLSAMRIRDLLTMGTGHDKDTLDRLLQSEDGNWAKAFLSAPVVHPPGSRFVYNSGATYMLSAILHKVAGQSLLDYLEPRLFKPLGIVGATWETCPRGIAAGGWGLSITTEDIAKFGQLYLQNGVWNNHQLLPDGWANKASSKQISNGDGGESDWTQGYGYQFWRCRHGAYRGDGAFGQFCVIMPEQDAVIVMTGGHHKLQEAMNAVWNHLLPAMEREKPKEDQAKHAELTARLDGLRLNVPQYASFSAVEHQLHGRTYEFEANPTGVRQVTVAFEEHMALLHIQSGAGEQTVTFGRNGQWRENKVQVTPTVTQRVAGRFTWKDSENLMLILCRVETPFTDICTCRPEGDELEMTIHRNTSAGESWKIRGKCVDRNR